MHRAPTSGDLSLVAVITTSRRRSAVTRVWMLRGRIEGNTCRQQSSTRRDQAECLVLTAVQPLSSSNTRGMLASSLNAKASTLPLHHLYSFSKVIMLAVDTDAD